MTSDQLGALFRHLGGSKEDHFGRSCHSFALAWFFTATRFHEWAGLTCDRLERSGDTIVTAQMLVKGGRYRSLSIPTVLAESISEWLGFREIMKGAKSRASNLNFACSALVFPGAERRLSGGKGIFTEIGRACITKSLLEDCSRYTLNILLPWPKLRLRPPRSLAQTLLHGIELPGKKMAILKTGK